MNSIDRRNKLIRILEESKDPIKGSELSKELKVSRQVIVQDIALIREKGYEVLATPRGYIIYNKDFRKTIKCKNHVNIEEIHDELKTIVDMGGVIKDVMIEHSIYGNIKVELNISSYREILNFIENIKSNEFRQLSTLSDNNHLHTIEASSKDIIDDIIKELRDKHILFE